MRFGRWRISGINYEANTFLTDGWIETISGYTAGWSW